MLKLFDTNVAIPFFPASWANSVTNWICGLCSPNQTISIQNTPNPDENGGCRIEVDVEQVYRLLRQRMEQDFVPRTGLSDALQSMTGPALNCNGGQLGINDEYLNEKTNNKSTSI